MSVTILFATLRQKLRGSGCHPFSSAMGRTLTDETLRYPDVALDRDPRNLREVRSCRPPKAIFEVLSPSTADEDIGDWQLADKRIDTVAAIVLIDPVDRRVELHERVAPNGWRPLILPPESGVTLAGPALALTFAEILASD